jgi:hypothetical protein
MCCTYLARANESDYVREADQISSHSQASSSAHLSNTIQVSQIIPASPSTQNRYEAPTIEVQPESDWKLRYAKDLIPSQRKKSEEKSGKKTKAKRKTRKQAKRKSNTKFIELLQGVGRKGSRIKVKVNFLLFKKKSEITLLYLF